MTGDEAFKAALAKGAFAGMNPPKLEAVASVTPSRVLRGRPRAVAADFRLPWNTTKTMADAWPTIAKRPVASPPVAVQPKPRVSARDVIASVCEKHKVTRKELLSGTRQHRVALCRQEAMYRMRAEVRIAGRPISFPEIGRRLGGLHHSSVIYGIQMHEARMRAAA